LHEKQQLLSRKALTNELSIQIQVLPQRKTSTCRPACANHVNSGFPSWSERCQQAGQQSFCDNSRGKTFVRGACLQTRRSDTYPKGECCMEGDLKIIRSGTTLKRTKKPSAGVGRKKKNWERSPDDYRVPAYGPRGTLEKLGEEDVSIRNTDRSGSGKN